MPRGSRYQLGTDAPATALAEVYNVPPGTVPIAFHFQFRTNPLAQLLEHLTRMMPTVTGRTGTFNAIA